MDMRAIVPTLSSTPRLFAALPLLGALFASACGSQEEATVTSEALSSQPSATTLFSPATKRVVIEVDYAPGAEPFVGSQPTFDDPWQIVRDNVRALLGDAKDLVVPASLDEMERLDDATPSEIGQEELLAIAERHRSDVSAKDPVTFYVVFLNGVFKDEEGNPSPETPGVSIRGTGVIGLFKPAIVADFVGPATPMFMEQTTLVHELGHAIGLVDGGIRPTTRHRAEGRGAHCGNPACIMYWKNVLVKDSVDFVDTYLKPRRGVLFGPECLEDVRAFARGRTAASAGVSPDE